MLQPRQLEDPEQGADWLWSGTVHNHGERYEVKPLSILPVPFLLTRTALARNDSLASERANLRQRGLGS